MRSYVIYLLWVAVLKREYLGLFENENLKKKTWRKEGQTYRKEKGRVKCWGSCKNRKESNPKLCIQTSGSYIIEKRQKLFGFPGEKGNDQCNCEYLQFGREPKDLPWEAVFSAESDKEKAVLTVFKEDRKVTKWPEKTEEQIFHQIMQGMEDQY